MFFFFFQERRGLLAKLFRDLDDQLAPNSGTRPKVVVLKNVLIFSFLHLIFLYIVPNTYE